MGFPSDIAVVFLPLFGAAVAGLAGRRIGDKASQILTSGCVLAATFISMFLFKEVGLAGHATNRVLFAWVQSGDLSATWGLKIDTLSVLMLVIVMIVSAMVHIYSIGYMSEDKSKPRFMAYLSLFTFFMSMLVTSPNLLQLFFGWEGVGLMSYLLINFWYERPSANTAAMKAFLVNRVGDIGFLLGIFGCFALLGSVDYTAMFATVHQFAAKDWIFLGHAFPALTTICVLLFVGACAKSAQLGLHTWLPDAMEGPTPVSTLIHAATMVTAGVFIVARMSPLFEYAPAALSFVAIVGALTAILAASIGLTQFDIKRVIAYSTMSQLGLMFIAAGASAYSASIFHLITHGFFKALLFLCVGSVLHALSGEQDMRKMGGLWRAAPITYALTWIGLLSLAGIGIDGIGFAGYYSKDLILESVVAQGTGMGAFVYILGLIAAFMTAFYSGRLLFMIFHGAPREDEQVLENAHESPWIMLAPLIPLAFGAAFSGGYAFDWFGSQGRSAFWNDAIFILPEHDSIAAAEHLSGTYKALPGIFAFLGLAMACIFYLALPELPAIASTAFGSVYRFVYHRFYIDEVYDKLFVRPLCWIGGVLSRKVDDTLIDGCGPDGFSGLSIRIGKCLSVLESGYLYHYAFAMILGIAGFVTWFWVKG